MLNGYAIINNIQPHQSIPSQTPKVTNNVLIENYAAP